MTYDLVVVGTGSAASTVASRCRKAGWRVAVADHRPFGGTCALRGCDPKKVLVTAGEALDWARRLDGKGVRGGAGLSIDWGELQAFKRTFTDPYPEHRRRAYEKAGIDAFHGRARFVGPSALQVGDQRIEARHVVVASGAVPAPLGVRGEEHVVDSTRFLELDDLPPRVAFIGGGYISMEFAGVAVRAGARVHVIHRGARPLKGFDPDLADRVGQAARAAGIDLRLETRVVGIAGAETGFTVAVESSAGSTALEVDLVVHGAGRVAEIDDLDVEAGQVRRGTRGVLVNEYLQSISNPAVYAAGDAAETDGLPLTPVAGLEGRTVATNLLEGNRARPDYSGTATVAFTLPPIASVGLTEAEATGRGLRYRTTFRDTSTWYSSRRLGASASASKILVGEETGRLLGAHLMGPGADELINLFALAVRQGLPASSLGDVLFAYPTHASDVQYMV